LSAGDRKGCIA